MSLAVLLNDGAGGTADQVQAVLRAVRRHLAMDVGFVSEFTNGRRVFRFSDGETLTNPIVVGASDPLEKSFCHYIARGLVPELMQDAGEDPIVSRMPVTRDLPVGAHLSVPLRHGDGTAFGSLCCFSFTPDRSLNTRDLGVLRLCADVITAVLKKDRTAALDREARRGRLEGLLASGAMSAVFQPIYRTADGRLTSFEALARFDAEPARPPDAWFAEAAEVGLGAELEFRAVDLALAALPLLDPTVALSINLSPTLVLDDRFARALSAAPLDRLILELTEHAGVESYEALRAALAPARAGGMRLAVDDVGAGHATFRHVLDLAPEIIKLDRGLIRGLDRDSARRALAEAITSYGRRIGCEVVAEGVETPAEYAVLRDLGVTRVQGYLTGRPMSLAEAGRLPLHAAPIVARSAA